MTSVRFDYEAAVYILALLFLPVWITAWASGRLLRVALEHQERYMRQMHDFITAMCPQINAGHVWETKTEVMEYGSDRPRGTLKECRLCHQVRLFPASEVIYREPVSE